MAPKTSETAPEETTTAPEATTTTPKAASSGRAYSIDRLLADSGPLLGVPKYVAAGGLHGCTGELTVADAKARIDKWLATPAQ